ncbi:MAG: VWA domain-containing protein [Bryobacteraceae bacterium]
MRSWSFFLLSAALAAQAQTGEVTTREETPTFRSSVNLVRVPVVVHDKQGLTVGSFHKEDFQLTDRGKPQSIAQFAIEGSAVTQPVPVGAGHAPPAAPQEEISGNPSAESSKLVVPTRFVAFVFDDVHLKIEDLMNARAAALKFIEQGLPPQERVALLTLSGNVSLEFTDDLAKFRETLMKVMPVPPRAHFPPASFFVADQWSRTEDLSSPLLAMQTAITVDCLQLQAGGGAPTQAGGALTTQAQQIAQDTLRQVANEGRSDAINAFRILNNVVRLLGAMPGDRMMIFVSPGMYLPDELQRELSESIDRATRSGVIINTLDARGVYTINPTGDVPNCRLTSPQTQEQVARYDHDAITSQGLILSDLADSTGGTALAQNDFLGEFNRLATPPEYVYYLGFYPKDLKPDGKYHEIKVTLANGKGLSVQARKGYWAPSHVEDAAATASREIGEAVFSHDELRDWPIDIHSQFYKTTADDAKVKVTTHLDIRQLPLRKQSDDRSHDDVTLVCVLFDRNGNYVQGTQKVVELRLKDENLERRRALGVTVNTDFDVKSGAYLIRVVARDSEGQQIAAANGVVEIP